MVAVTDSIQWPKRPKLIEPGDWAHNISVVKMLCDMGEIRKWTIGTPGRDMYVKMPNVYRIEKVEIEFLPHWDEYMVGGIYLSIPQTEADVRLAVEAVKTLQLLGYKVPKS